MRKDIVVAREEFNISSRNYQRLIANIAGTHENCSQAGEELPCAFQGLGITRQEGDLCATMQERTRHRKPKTSRAAGNGDYFAGQFVAASLAKSPISQSQTGNRARANPDAGG